MSKNQITHDVLLSLDASSTEIGYTIFNSETKELIEIDHFSHRKETSLLDRAIEFGKLLDALKIKYPRLKEMVLEEAFVAMYGTTSNAQTVATLLQVNAMYQLMGHFKGLKVNLITVRDSRKFTFPGIQLKKLSTLAKMKEKEYCFHLAIEKHLSTIKLPQKTLSRGPRKGQLVYEDYAYDMVDSFIVGMGFLNQK